jgi:hypothetical protein
VDGLRYLTIVTMVQPLTSPRSDPCLKMLACIRRILAQREMRAAPLPIGKIRAQETAKMSLSVDIFNGI